MLWLESFLWDRYNLDVRHHRALKKSIDEIAVEKRIPWKNFEKAMRDHSGIASPLILITSPHWKN